MYFGHHNFEGVGELLGVDFREDEPFLEVEVFEAEWGEGYMLVRVLLRREVLMASREEGVTCEEVGREEHSLLLTWATDLSCILWFGGNRN